MSTNDYDYGLSSGHNQAAVIVSREGMKSDNAEVRAFANDMLRMLGERADEITAEIRDRQDIARERLAGVVLNHEDVTGHFVAEGEE